MPGPGGLETVPKLVRVLGATQPVNEVIQFSKTPFTLASAQVANGRWQIEFGAGQHSWRGRGTPPARFVWFQLGRVLAGTPADAPWKFTGRVDRFWRLENPVTGEFLEGRFFQ